MPCYQVIVKPHSKQNSVTISKNNSITVKLTQSAQKNKANKQLVWLLSDHFHIKPGQVIIRTGHNQPHKTIVIDH